MSLKRIYCHPKFIQYYQNWFLGFLRQNQTNTNQVSCVQICQIAELYPTAIFLKVNYEELKTMCQSLHIHVLPFFRFYRGAEGRVCSFSCTNATVRIWLEKNHLFSGHVHVMFGNSFENQIQNHDRQKQKFREVASVYQHFKFTIVFERVS